MDSQQHDISIATKSKFLEAIQELDPSSDVSELISSYPYGQELIDGSFMKIINDLDVDELLKIIGSIQKMLRSNNS